MTKAFLREDYQTISKGSERVDLSFAGSLAYPQSLFRNPEMSPGRIQKRTLVYTLSVVEPKIFLSAPALENSLFFDSSTSTGYFKNFFYTDRCMFYPNRIKT
jgi:hypothetical protein